jgi:hypothetical protein
MGKKKKWGWFNNGQLAYLSSFFWNTDHHIHAHMARIKAEPFDPDQAFFSKLSASIPTESDSNDYVRKYIFKSATPCLFQLQSEYEPFTSNPLLGFVMLGIDADHHIVFSGASDKRIPADKVVSSVTIRNRAQAPRISTLNSICRNARIVPSQVVGHASPTTSGTILELALLGSSMLATRVGSLYGTSVKDYLNHLCWELDFNGVDRAPAALRAVDRRFMAAFSGFKVPFVSPMASEVWDPAFVEELKSVCNVVEPYLGIAYPSVRVGERCDFAVSVWTPETPALPKNQLPDNPIIVGQCKMYSRSVGTKDFKEKIFPSFDSFPGCQLFIVVAFEYTNFRTLRHDNYFLWAVKRGYGGELQLKEACKDQSANARQHIGLISLKEVFTGTNFDHYRKKLLRGR